MRNWVEDKDNEISELKQHLEKDEDIIHHEKEELENRIFSYEKKIKNYEKEI